MSMLNHIEYILKYAGKNGLKYINWNVNINIH